MANSLVIESSKESLLKEKLPWVINIKNLLEENGMLTFFFINSYDDRPCFVNNRIFQTLRIQISKFRLSNHNLMIETGRHKNIIK